MLQDFYSVHDHFTTLRSKGLKQQLIKLSMKNLKDMQILLQHRKNGKF